MKPAGRAICKQLESAIQDKRFIAESSFARRSAQIIKMHEDKRNRGAIVASLSKPAIPDSENAFDGVGGYHLVWPRDLYHAAMGLARGGRQHHTAERAALPGKKSTSRWLVGTEFLGRWHRLLARPADGRSLVSRFCSRVSSKSRGAFDSLASRSRHGPPGRELHHFSWSDHPGRSLGRNRRLCSFNDRRGNRGTSRGELLTGDSSDAQVANQWQSMLERWTLVTNGPWGQKLLLARQHRPVSRKIRIRSRSPTAEETPTPRKSWMAVFLNWSAWAFATPAILAS